MVFLISSKTIGDEFDAFEPERRATIGAYNLIEKGETSSITEESARVLEGNIYGVEGLKTIKDLDKDLEGFLETVEGSFTVVSIQQNELKVYRDNFGSRPIYFLAEGDELFVSNRIKPLLEFTDPKPNIEVCKDYLHSGLVDHTSETFFEGIKQLRSGQSLSFVEGYLELEEVDFSKNEIEKDLDKVVDDSVEKSIPQEHFVCPISGGLDSTILASKSMDKDAEFVHSGFDIETGDEEYFNIVEEQMGLEVENIEIKISDLLNEVEDSIDVFEQPTSMMAIQAQNVMFRRIKNSFGGSTILDGTGADELFYGYSKFIPYYISEEIGKNVVKGLRELKNYRHRLSSYGLREIFRIITRGLYPNHNHMPELDHVPDYERPRSLREAGEVNLEDYNFPHVLHSLDKSREKYDHTIRLGFLSSDLRKKLEDKNPAENFQSGLTKYLLRSCYKDHIPEKIFNRKKKTGFLEPDASDLNQEDIEKFDRVFSSESFRGRELFDGDMFYRRFKKGRQDFFKCYRFYCFECWMRYFID